MGKSFSSSTYQFSVARGKGGSIHYFHILFSCVASLIFRDRVQAISVWCSVLILWDDHDLYVSAHHSPIYLSSPIHNFVSLLLSLIMAYVVSSMTIFFPVYVFSSTFYTGSFQPQSTLTLFTMM